ncbi:MAG: DegV family protein [Bacilli bacterium]
MRKVNLITDCTSDLTPELYKKHQIDILPLYVTFGSESYRDGIDITTEQLYEKVNETKNLPKTAALPPLIFQEAFEKYPADEDIIFMGLGSDFSVSYSNAVIIARDFPNVYVIDSQNLSAGIGLQLLKICEFRAQGLSAPEIVEKMSAITPLVRTQFAIDTLEYLHMGGRCSGTSRFFGTMLRIKPIIRVVNGIMEIAKKPHGKYIKALNVLLEYFANDASRVDPFCVVVTHSLAEDDATYLINIIKNEYGFANVIETRASGVISTHCGPRTIGILYVLKNEVL